MHLYGEILEKYLARELPQKTLSTIDAHVSNCLFCAHTLAGQRSVATRWERRGWLGRLIRLDESPIADLHVDERRAKAA
jgi:homoserine acetyltransferase